ncbi:MAG TPA: hypothetical protein VGR48_13020 [Terriglobales bacterium]|nr:hypothetical protein [Terriglobales bacterium]
MELLLNLAWVLVAVAAVVLWLRQNRRGVSAARVSLLLQSIALACALAVLFPAISATDDLHAAQLAVEAQDVARKVLRSMNTVSSSSAVDWLHFLPAFLLLAVMLAPCHRFVRTVSKSPVFALEAACFASLTNRAPPAQISA